MFDHSRYKRDTFESQNANYSAGRKYLARAGEEISGHPHFLIQLKNISYCNKKGVPKLATHFL